MRNNRLSMSLIFALSYGAIACGGADESVNENSAESLKRGRADGGSRAHDDADSDTDEAIDEASVDGGKRRRGWDFGDDSADGGDCRRGRGLRGRGHQDADRDEASDERSERDERDDDGLTGPKLDGGSRRGGRRGVDGGAVAP